jgi:hypothetical protein
MMKVKLRKRTRLQVGLLIATSVLVARAAKAQDATEYDYIGSAVTNMSGVSCMPVSTNADQQFPNNEIIRSIASGLSVSSSWAGGALSYTCPLSRRNSSTYGDFPTNSDRVLVTSLRVSVFDGNSTDGVACVASIQTATGSFYNSSWLNACGSSGGCASPPPASFVGGTELLWTNPFGTTPITNLGAVDVSYVCLVPAGSSIYWAEAAYSPN